MCLVRRIPAKTAASVKNPSVRPSVSALWERPDNDVVIKVSNYFVIMYLESAISRTLLQVVIQRKQNNSRLYRISESRKIKSFLWMQMIMEIITYDKRVHRQWEDDIVEIYCRTLYRENTYTCHKLHAELAKVKR